MARTASMADGVVQDSAAVEASTNSYPSKTCPLPGGEVEYSIAFWQGAAVFPLEALAASTRRTASSG